jgi:hypothetical protein
MKNQTNTPKQLARASAERQKVLEDQRRGGPGVTPLSALDYGLIPHQIGRKPQRNWTPWDQ